MDINLKNNKSINIRILITAFCIIMLPILLRISDNYFTQIYFLVLLDLIAIVLLLVNIIKKQFLIFKETSILKLYNGIFLEIRVLLILVILYLERWLYTFMFSGDNISISITIIFAFILLYLAQIDIYKLYLLNVANDLENYICENSILCKLYKLIKEGFLTKSLTSKMLVSIIVLIFYATVIYSMGYLADGTFNLSYIFLSIERNFFKFIIFVIFPTIAIITCFLYIFIEINKLNMYTYNVANGNYDTKIDLREQLFFKDITKNIMDIENGLDIALDKAIKSERLKSELITNVSHDLKTPLTSIINYVNLLDNNNISDEKRKAYLGILKERSLRLKVLIEDLFEASKATSGNLEMHLEDLDPVALLRQTLGEFEDKISISNLEFIKKIPEQKTTIYADGKKNI